MGRGWRREGLDLCGGVSGVGLVVLGDLMLGVLGLGWKV